MLTPYDLRQQARERVMLAAQDPRNTTAEVCATRGLAPVFAAALAEIQQLPELER